MFFRFCFVFRRIMQCSVSLLLVVSTSAIDCMERSVSKMTCYVSCGTLNPTHWFTHFTLQREILALARHVLRFSAGCSFWCSHASWSYRSLTPSVPAVPNCCCSKGSAPYWSNQPFLIFDIWALWCSVLSARVLECQKLKMVG